MKFLDLEKPEELKNITVKELENITVKEFQYKYIDNEITCDEFYFVYSNLIECIEHNYFGYDEDEEGNFCYGGSVMYRRYINNNGCVNRLKELIKKYKVCFDEALNGVENKGFTDNVLMIHSFEMIMWDNGLICLCILGENDVLLHQCYGCLEGAIKVNFFTLSDIGYLFS